MAEQQAQIEQKTAVVTGAGSGIGRRIALQLAGLGWRVIAIARSEDTLRALALEASGIEPAPADLTSLDVVGLLPERIDALVHAAGTATARSVADAEPQEWEYAFKLNVVAAAELVRHALPALRESRGTVVLINSGAGLFTRPGNTLYSVTKHGLRALADGLRKEEERHGVRVTSIYPGPTDTPMFTAEIDREQLIRPETVAQAAVTAITAAPDAQLTEIQVRPRQEPAR